MKMEKIKKHYERFKQWQEKPIDYEFATNEVHRCNNCGHDFTGNYCPYCSQKAGDGVVGWNSVRQSMMDIWGLGTRSLPRTLLQLLFRPGYLIGDYISGKRQVSFPPVKMLFVIAVIVVFWIYYLMPLVLGDTFDVYGGKLDMVGGLATWNKGHFIWTYFVMALIFILPTWVMFRYAPRHTLHTLPQGFFIQIFLLILNLVVSFIVLSPIASWNYDVYYYFSTTALLIYFLIAFKQLFGYGTWGTLWRMLFIFCAGIYTISTLMFIMFDIDTSHWEQGQSVVYSQYYYAGTMFSLALFIMALGWIVNLIATRKVRKQLKANHE